METHKGYRCKSEMFKGYRVVNQKCLKGTVVNRKCQSRKWPLKITPSKHFQREYELIHQSISWHPHIKLEKNLLNQERDMPLQLVP